MKILILSNYYPPHMIGGYERACQQTVDYLRYKGHEVEVLTSDWQANTKIIEKGVHRKMTLIDYQNPTYSDKWKVEWHNYRLTSQMIQSYNPDLIYVWSLRVVSLGPLYAAQKSNLPCIFEIGDFWPDSYFKPGIKSLLKRKAKAILPITLGGPVKIDPVISVSHWMAQELREKYNTQTIHVIPNGTPCSITPPPDKKTSDTFINVLFIGRIDPEKGLHLALESMGKLKRKKLNKEIKLTVVGKGDASYLEKCKSLIQTHQLQEQVSILGHIDDPTEMYLKHDLLLMPTLMREPFGLVIIEAMMQGLPVLASNKYGPAEIIHDDETGYLFELGNVNALTKRLTEIIQNPESLHHIRKTAYQYALSHYSLNLVKSKVEQVLISQINQEVAA